MFEFCHFRVRILAWSVGSSCVYLPSLSKSHKMHGIVLLVSMEGMPLVLPLCWYRHDLYFHSCKARSCSAIILHLSESPPGKFMPRKSPSSLGVLAQLRMFHRICLGSHMLSLLPLALTGSSSRIFSSNTGSNLIPRTGF